MIQHRRFLFYTLLLLSGLGWLASWPTAVFAQTTPTFYVALDGSDEQGDGSAERPFRTLTHAAPLAPPGSIIYLRGGIYQEQTVFTAVGTATNPITIMPAPGEEVIFDGSGLPIPEDQHLVLLRESAHTLFANFEIRHSSGRGLGVFESDWVTLRGNRVHDIIGRGIGGGGDHITIEENEVWRTSLENENQAFDARGGWKAGISTYRRFDGSPSTHFIIRRNHIHDIWGEGIIAIFADGVEISGNEVHDSYSVNIYIDNARNVTIQGNHLYATTTRYNRRGRFVPANGIHLANEAYDNPPPTQLDQILIANNLIVGTGRGISYWHDQSNLSPRNSYRNISIVNNVIANTHEDAIRFDGVGLTSLPPQNVLVQNNIIFAGGNGEALNVANPDGWTFSHNNWPDGVPPLAMEPNSFAADPLFANGRLGGTPRDYTLQPGSSSIGAGRSLALVPTDFANVAWAEPPSLGILAWVDSEPTPTATRLAVEGREETAVFPTPASPTPIPPAIAATTPLPTPIPAPQSSQPIQPAAPSPLLLGGFVLLVLLLLVWLLRRRWRRY